MPQLTGHTTSRSQPEVLRRAMTNAGLRHAERATVNLRHVAAWPTGDPRRVEVRFCNIDRLHIIGRDKGGDDKPLPDVVQVEGFKVDEPGFFDLYGAQLHSNGVIQVRCTQNTRVERIGDLNLVYVP